MPSAPARTTTAQTASSTDGQCEAGRPAAATASPASRINTNTDADAQAHAAAAVPNPATPIPTRMAHEGSVGPSLPSARDSVVIGAPALRSGAAGSGSAREQL